MRFYAQAIDTDTQQNVLIIHLPKRGKHLWPPHVWLYDIAENGTDGNQSNGPSSNKIGLDKAEMKKIYIIPSLKHGIG